MSKELAKKEATELALADSLMTKDEAAQMIADMGISASDITINRLLLAQAGSTFNDQANSKVGDIVRNDLYTVVADGAKTVEVVPLDMTKSWIEYVVLGANQKEYLTSYAVTAENERQGWEGITPDGQTISRDYCMNFAIALRSELVSGLATLPLIVTFKKTSLPAGKAIASQIVKLSMMMQRPYSQSILLSSAKPTVEKGKAPYAVFVAKAGTKLNAEELAAAESLAKMARSLRHKVPVDDTSFDGNKLNSAQAANCGEDLPI